MSPSVVHQLQAHAQALRGLARDLVGEGHADDLLQETAIQALTAPPRRPGPLGGWFASVLRHLASKHKRGERRRGRREELAARSEALPPADAELLARDTFRQLNEAVLGLPQPYQGVLLRRYLQDEPPMAIAAATGVPLATVKSQLQRGLAILRERLARDGRGNWRLGFGVVFGFHKAAAVTTAATGGVLMASGVKVLACGVAVVFALAAVLYQASSPAQPTPSPGAAAPPLADVESSALAGRALAGNALAAPTHASADPATRVEVPATATWVVQGRVVRRSDTPLPGAKVRARAFHGTHATGEPAIEALLTAGADGHFAWPLDPPDEITFFELRGVGERVRAHAETFVVAPGDPPPPAFDVWMYPLDALARGVVLDDVGRPIAGARVGAEWRGGVRTDTNGRFEVPVARSPSVTLYASASGFVQLRRDVPIDVGSGEGEVELRMRPARRLHGRVTDAGGRPIAGAVVRTFHTIFADAAETDADGRYVLDNLDPSLHAHSVFARKDGFVEAKVEVETTAPGTEQDLVMQHGVAVHGVVFGPDRRPVPAATVFLGFSPSAYDRQDAVTGLDGRFAFACVGPGEHTVNVERSGLAGQRMKVTVPKAPAAAVEVRFDLAAGHFVGGVVRGTDDKPIAGVSVAPQLDREYLDGIRGRTDAEGRFRLDGVPARGLSLEFYGSGVVRKEVPVAEVDRVDLAVVLERHGALAGTVIDGRTGEPLRSFRIRFGQPRLVEGEEQGGGYSAMWLRGGKMFHDAAGSFRIEEEVPVGSVFALEASAEGFAPLVHDRVVVQTDPDPAALVFRLLPGVAVEGAVRDRRTALPIAGARLKAFVSGRPLMPHEPNDDEGRPIAQSDARGAFRLDNVSAGPVYVRVEHPDWLPVLHGPIMVTPAGAVPFQNIVLDHGATVTVDVRKADGSALPDAEIVVVVNHGEDRSATSDATGTARIEGVPPGEHELVLVQRHGAVRAWSFRRLLRVGNEDCRTEFVASDGDATLVVILDATDPLPEGLQLLCTPAKPEAQPAPGVFRSRNVAAQPGRTVITDLPAMELRVFVMGTGFLGSAVVTTRSGETVEVRIPVGRTESGR